jgi:hypothetical protein
MITPRSYRGNVGPWSSKAKFSRCNSTPGENWRSFVKRRFERIRWLSEEIDLAL